MYKLVGRTKEIKQLEAAEVSGKSEFVAIYGRRRVGKTFLIREHFAYKFDFQLTGLANANTKQQLVNFQVTLQRQAKTAGEVLPENWFEAFQQLINYLERLKVKRKIVIFLDELPWLDTKRSDFMTALEHFWNSWATSRKDILLVGCGSAASWMTNNLISDQGGLHNRVTVRIKIHPFNLQETELMLQAKHNIVDRYQILQIYMVTGGIPFYLDAISPSKSASQNIEDLCFRKGALLVTEFKNLFTSLFNNAEQYENIIIALSSKTKGISRTELSKATGIKTGGSLTKKLNELEESGFITRYSPFGKKVQHSLYRLSDFYSCFYLKFIRNNRNYSPGVWLNSLDNPAQRAWVGFAFEQVCLAHIPQIKKALGISGVITNAQSWKSTTTKKGAQVDLVIERRDQIINLCEVKFSINKVKINKAYAENLRNKIGAFKEETQTRKSVFLTMISTYGVQKNKYASLVQNDIKMDALFI